MFSEGLFNGELFNEGLFNGGVEVCRVVRGTKGCKSCSKVGEATRGCNIVRILNLVELHSPEIGFSTV